MRRNRWLLFCAVLLVSAGCDHATKQLVQAALAGSRGVSLAHGAVRLELVANPGAFLSLGARLPDWLRSLALLGGVPLILVAASAVLLRSDAIGGSQRVAGALFVGGGLANWLDRLLHGGAVTDFVSLGLGGLRTGVFNLADVAIVLGLALFLLPLPRVGRRPVPERDP